MAAGFVVFLVNTIIGFFVSPYIVAKIGREAYGFSQLAGNFVTYATIATTAINSMLSRFIAVKVHQDDYEGANRYYMSAFVANIVMAIVLAMPAAYCVFRIESILKVPVNLVDDVRMTFIFTFSPFLLFMPTCVFNSAVFVRNKLYLSSMRMMQASLIRISLLLMLFAIFPPKVFYLPLAAFIAAFFTAYTNLQYKRRLLPEMTFQKKYLSFSAIKDLFFSGIWNVVTKISSILSTGLDLLVANLMIDASSMGMLSIAKMVPNLIISFVSSVTTVFLPNLTKLYAKGQTELFIANIKKSMKIIGVIVSIPIAGLIAYGDAFFRLWMPTLDAGQLTALSLITPSHPLP